VRVLFVVATVADLALAALLVAVSGFVFGSGPESVRGGALALAGYSAAVIACVAAPIAGFFLSKRGERIIGLAVAWLPSVGALGVMIIPAPY
jgi:hypothetical protein